MKCVPLTIALLFALCSIASPHAEASQFTTISLAGVANGRLQDANSAFPTGAPVVLGGVPFDIGATGNNFFFTGEGNPTGTVTLTVPINVADVTGVDTLINTGWGQPGPSSFASLTFLFNDNSTFVKNLVGNVDIRDYFQNVFTNSINGTTTTQVFTTTNPGNAGPGTYRLDKQFIDLSAFSGKTLVSMTLTDTGGPNFQRTFLSGVTVRSGSVTAVPEPSSVIAFGGGLLALLAYQQRRRTRLS